MTQNKKIGYAHGIIVDLRRESDEVEGRRTYWAPDELVTISVVLEKTQRPSSLKNCSYNSFTLRQMLFFHQCSYNIEVYAPLMAVNLTKNVITIRDKPVKKVSRTCRTMLPNTNSFINLHSEIKPKLFMKIDEFN